MSGICDGSRTAKRNGIVKRSLLIGVLEQLFRGKIDPVDWTPQLEEHRRCLKNSGDIGRELSADLTKEQKKKLDQYIDACLDTEIIIQEEIFCKAFVLGVQLQREVTLLSEKKKG